MKKIIVTWGLIAGAILAAAMWATLPWMERIGFEYGAAIGYTGMVLAFLMVYFGVRGYREQRGGSALGFGRAFGVGMGIVAVATACYVLSWQVMLRFVIPDFPQRYAAHAVDKARQAGADAAQLAALQREMEDFQRLYAQPLVSIGFSVLEPLPVGLLAALTSAALLRRRAR